MKALKLASVACMLLAAPALVLAQPAEGGGGGRGPRGGGFGGGRPPGPPPVDRIIDRLSEELELTDDQRAQVETIFAAHQEEIDAHHEQVRGLMDQMREARDAGDDARVEELREEFRALREAGSPIQTAMSEVETILTDEQAVKYSEMQQRMRERRGQGGPGGPGGRNPQELMESLPDELSMDETQRTQYAELTSNLQAQFEAHRAAMEETWPLFEEMRAAREAGDEARVQELREQLRAKRQELGNPMRDFMNGLNGILTAEQQTKLRELMSQGREGRQGRGGQRARLPQANAGSALIKAVRQLDLSSVQKKAVDTILDEAMKEFRQAENKTREAQREFFEKAKERIVAEVLTADQAQKLEEILLKEQQKQREENRAGRRGRGASEDSDDGQGQGQGQGRGQGRRARQGQE